MLYRKSFITLFYALGLLLAAEANAFALFNKDPATVAPSAVSSRQLTRSRLVSRLERKASLEAHRKAHGRALEPRQSPGQLGTCDTVSAGAGWAEFRNYNAPGNNLGLLVRDVQTAAECAEICRSRDNCIGFSWRYSTCYPKENLGAAVASMYYDESDNKWSTWFLASCAELSGSTSATCCNSQTNYGTTCSSPTVGVTGYSEYYLYNAPGNNLGDIDFSHQTPEACRQFCESRGNQCVGFSFNPDYSGGACVLKQNLQATLGTISPVGDSGPWSTWIRGSCGTNNFGTSASCCNTVAN